MHVEIVDASRFDEALFDGQREGCGPDLDDGIRRCLWARRTPTRNPPGAHDRSLLRKHELHLRLACSLPS